MKKVVVLGSTGSIGTNALRVLQSLKEQFEVVGLTAGKNRELLLAQAAEFRPQWIFAEDAGALARERGAYTGRILADENELCAAVQAADVDIILCGISGKYGLRPAFAALRGGKRLALASKEVLVMAGELMLSAACEGGAELLPVDSEHCAIHQCMAGNRGRESRRLILTCSGGPFHAHPEKDLAKVTLAETMRHPTWRMGRKITIDCATLMNKGLEIIEATHFFHVPEEKIEVVIHPQSIVHSMVEFCDGSVLAQMGSTDMRLPIQYCLTYPERIPSGVPFLDFASGMDLSFTHPDERRFSALRLARTACHCGNAGGTFFNASNEVAVDFFVRGKLRFDRIPVVVEKALERCCGVRVETLDDVLAADAEARRIATEICAGVE